MEAIHQLEIEIILFLQSLGNWLAGPLRSISQLGSENFFMVIMPALYWCLSASTGLRVAVMLLLSNAFGTVFKIAFHQPRPYWFDTRVQAFSSETSFGLPSGHSFQAASNWGMLAVLLKMKWAQITLVVVIFLIGFSRIFLGVHFISDVLVGWALGGLLLWIYLRVEKPLLPWLKTKSLRVMLLLAAASSVVLIAIVLLSAAALSSWELPAVWQVNALAAYPGNIIDPVNTESAYTIAGTWFGMLAGVAWMFHWKGGFNATGTPAQLLLRYLLGMVGIFVLYIGLGSIFPREASLLSYSLRFVRYSLIGLWVSAFAPLLFERFNLVNPTQKSLPSLSTD